MLALLAQLDSLSGLLFRLIIIIPCLASQCNLGVRESSIHAELLRLRLQDAHYLAMLAKHSKKNAAQFPFHSVF